MTTRYYRTELVVPLLVCPWCVLSSTQNRWFYCAFSLKEPINSQEPIRSQDAINSQAPIGGQESIDSQEPVKS